MAQQIKVLKIYPDGNYELDIDGRKFTTLTGDEARQAEVDRLEASKVPGLNAQIAGQTKLITAMEAQIADLKKLADLDTRIVAVNSKIVGLGQQVETLRQAQHGDAIKLLASMEAVQAGGKKSWLDKALGEWPVKLGTVGIGIAANSRTAFFPPSPCAPAGMVMPRATVRFQWGKH